MSNKIYNSSATYYIIRSIRRNGKRSSEVVERLGTADEIKAAHGCEDAALIEKDKRVVFNVGYLFLQKIYYELGLPSICKRISARHSFEYGLNSILSRLLCCRILFPSSKLSCMSYSEKLLEQPNFDLHQIYRALSVIAEESDFIQAELYKNSKKVLKRQTGVLFYDCTNFFFETDYPDGIKQFGVSKEHRPNPIVQIVEVNRNRWEIEESFWIMKTDFEARPVYLRRDDRIKAHFMTCFAALMIYRVLERKLGEKFTCGDIVKTLREMNVLQVKNEGYTPAYTRTDLTDKLHETAGFRTDNELTSGYAMKGILRKSKNM